MCRSKLVSHLFAVTSITVLLGCEGPQSAKPVPVPSVASTPWMGISSAVNQVVIAIHDGTGWLLNKSEVSVKKSGEVRAIDGQESVADFQIAVRYGGESFETTAKDVPCDKDGIPTESSIDRIRTAVEDIKAKMKRLQK